MLGNSPVNEPGNVLVHMPAATPVNMPLDMAANVLAPIWAMYQLVC